MRFNLGTVRQDFKGHEALALLYKETKSCVFEDIEVDLSKCHWFDAHMCAPFGAVLHKLTSNLNSIQITNISQRVESILSKNGFLSSYGRTKVPDKWGTTIPYQRFDIKDDRFFGTYVETELMCRTQIPRMSKGLTKKFRESVFEIFSNAVTHSRTDLGIFCCGQFFPGNHRIDFSIADLGIGIRRNIQESIGREMKPDEAIVWATEGNNTTRRGPIPGGLGLKLLKEFVSLNHGQIQIVSDSGYWCFKENQYHASILSAPFPGTVVSIEINTADRSAYVLQSELSSENIF